METAGNGDALVTILVTLLAVTLSTKIFLETAGNGNALVTIFYSGLASGITDSWMVTDVIALPLTRAWGAKGGTEGCNESWVGVGPSAARGSTIGGRWAHA